MSETATPDLTLEPDPEKRKRAAPWGDGVFVRVVFPCQVRQREDQQWEARCRELKITVAGYGSREAALEALRQGIRELSVEARNQKVGS